MSIQTARYMYDALIAACDDDEAMGWQMIALATAIDWDREVWMAIVSPDDPHDAAAEAVFWDIHERWPVMWSEMGDAFWDILTPLIDAWKRVLGSKYKVRV